MTTGANIHALLENEVISQERRSRASGGDTELIRKTVTLKTK